MGTRGRTEEWEDREDGELMRNAREKGMVEGRKEGRNEIINRNNGVSEHIAGKERTRNIEFE